MKKLDKYTQLLKKTIFFEVFTLIKKNPKLYFLILLMDVVFLVSAYLFGSLGKLFLQPIMDIGSVSIALASIPVYVLLLILINSYTKYTALHFVKNLVKKSSLSFKRIKSFYLLHLAIIAISGAIVFFFVLVINYGIKEDYVSLTAKIILFILALFVYSLINISHSLFALGLSFKEVMKKCFRFTFTKIGKYYGVFVFSLFVFAIFVLIYYLLGIALIYFSAFNPKMYNLSLVTVASILIYVLQSYNRIYFYLIAKKIE